MTRFDDYNAAVNPGLRLTWKHHLLSSTGELIASTDDSEVTGSVMKMGATVQPMTWRAGRLSQRTVKMEVVGNRPEFVTKNAQGLLHPTARNSVRIFAGVRTNSAVNWFTVGTLDISSAPTTSDRKMVSTSLSLVARTRPLLSELVTALRFDEGALVSQVVQELGDQVMGDTPFVAATSSYDLPAGSVEPGRSRLENISRLLTGIGHELADTPEGAVITRPILPTVDGSGQRWRYGQDNGIPVHRAVITWTDRIPQAVRIEGGSFQNFDHPIEVTVFDTDPASQGYHDGQKPPVIETIRSPFIRTATQAIDAGFGRLRRIGTGPLQVLISTLPNPAMTEGDLVDLELPEFEISGSFRVIEYTLPVQPEASTGSRPPRLPHMTVLLRQTWDPQVNWSYQPDGDGTGEGTVSDDFNRPYENLEDLPPPGEPGSPNWTEFGWSWAVVGERAIQRYSGGWSFARYNTPLSSSNHRVDLVVYPKADGRVIGPMMRSTGQHDGYSAVADVNGRIRVAFWVNGRQEATLGDFDYGSDLTGHKVSLGGVGNTLTVYVDDVALGSITEDRQHGTYVGMNAFGGSGQQAPAGDNFFAEVL